MYRTNDEKWHKQRRFVSSASQAKYKLPKTKPRPLPPPHPPYDGLGIGMAPRVSFRRLAVLASTVVLTVILVHVCWRPDVSRYYGNDITTSNYETSLPIPTTPHLTPVNFASELLKDLTHISKSDTDPVQYIDLASDFDNEPVGEDSTQGVERLKHPRSLPQDSTNDVSPLGLSSFSTDSAENGAARSGVPQGSTTGPGKFWFFKDGTVRPTKTRSAHVWPFQNPDSDRIVEQLMYIPETYDPSRVKTVMLSHWNLMDMNVFESCPVSACRLSETNVTNADAVLFQNFVNLPSKNRPDQIWIIYELESPVHMVQMTGADQASLVDWTATYRWDSDIVTPYEKWVYYDERVRTNPNRINYAANKTGQVAWFVSNCHASNERSQYALELAKYISVDIYGSCGPLKCPRTAECFQLLDTKYKFYLSFENSNCKDYITEKFFVNGLGHAVLPIVMGASKAAYLRAAPHHSFLHVNDFESPRELARYLHVLDKNDKLYNSYFAWKGTGEFVNTFFWCRLCTMLHDADSGMSGRYPDINRWWKSEGVCDGI
ncbi:hypothetical protein M8J76_012938 [Diaphorina citri]|nr:hypothetical protein M8J76_012938 [Diaphorina citri]